VVSIVPETAHYARTLQAKRGVPFRVLTDLDLGYALSLGLAFWVGDKIKQMYKGFGIDLAEFQGNGGWLLPIPATLVVGRNGRVRARFVDPDFRHRMRMEEVLAAVRNGAKTWSPSRQALGALAIQVEITGTKAKPPKVFLFDLGSRALNWAIVNLGGKHMSLGTILIIILILILLGVIPTWGHSRDWGYGPSGIVGLILVILLILLLLGKI
jgi:peroxiredoxin